MHPSVSLTLPFSPGSSGASPPETPGCRSSCLGEQHQGISSPTRDSEAQEIPEPSGVARAWVWKRETEGTVHDPCARASWTELPFLALSGAQQTQRITVQARQGLWCHTDPQDDREGWAGLWEVSRLPVVRESGCPMDLTGAKPYPRHIGVSNSLLLPQVSAERHRGQGPSRVPADTAGGCFI